MALFKKTEEPQQEREESSGIPAELPTILSSLIHRLEQLEHRVDALEETITGMVGPVKLSVSHSIRKSSQKPTPSQKSAPTPKAEEPALEVEPVEKTGRAKIARGKPIRPFKKED